MKNQKSKIKNQILKKIVSENRLYVWLLVFTLFLGAFSYLNQNFFNQTENGGLAMKDALAFKDLSQEDLIEKIEADKPLLRIFSVIVLLGSMIFFAGIYLSLRFFSELSKGKIPFFSKEFSPVDWTILDLVKVLIIILFFINLLCVAEPFLAKVFILPRANLFVFFILKSFAVDLFVLGVVLYFALKKYTAGFAGLGLKLSGFYKNIIFGVLHYIGFIPCLFAVVFLSFFLAGLFGYEAQPASIFAVFFHPQPKFLLVLFALFVVLFGPIIEEIFFRGFCYPALKNKIGPLKAAVVISFIFAWLHMNMLGFLPIFVLGLLLVYLYEMTNSLVASITVHVIHNSVILYLVFLYRSLMLR